MSGKININLLPQELAETKKANKKRELTARISIFVLAAMIGISALVFSFSLTQAFRLSGAQKEVTEAETTVQGFNEAESLLTGLKSRISGISTVNKDPYPQAQIYQYITTQVPEGVNLLSLTTDRTGNTIIVGETASVAALDTFFNRLTEKADKNEVLQTLNIENFNMSPESGLKFTLTFDLVGATLPKAKK